MYTYIINSWVKYGRLSVELENTRNVYIRNRTVSAVELCDALQPLRSTLGVNHTDGHPLIRGVWYSKFNYIR